MLTCEGILMKPRLADDISTEEWMELMKTTGLPGIMEEKSASGDKSFGSRGLAEMKAALDGIAEAI